MEDKIFSLEMAKYHHDIVQSRRSIILKIFTGTVVLYLLLAKGAFDYAADVGAEYGQFVILMRSISVSIVILYVFASAQIEHSNLKDRTKYRKLQNDLWKEVGYKGLEYRDPSKETFSQKLWTCWAFTAPVIAVAGMAVGLWWVVELLCPCVVT